MTDINALLTQMTLEQKAALCSGADWWHTKSIRSLGISSLMMTDGPHGLRKQDESSSELFAEGVKAVCFPAACATACSFDRDLLFRMGEALGEECLVEKVAVLLGPGANIKRSPLCGRNFEYFSEDPCLTGQAAAALVGGIQSKGIGASLKHFAVNNQEHYRLVADSIVDERTLREIYFAGFEYAIKSAKPWTVMCSYNKLNGVQVSENKELLTGILRNEWEYGGVVISDWGAVNDRVKAILAGLDLEMPYCGEFNDEAIVEAVRNGDIPESVLDETVRRILALISKCENRNTSVSSYDKDMHDALAADIETESAVLLKNDGVLPFNKSIPVLFVGEFAKTPRCQGGGSSHINTHKITSALDVAKRLGINAVFAENKNAVELAPRFKNIVIFAGLPDEYESEGYDRRHMRLPAEQNELIARICAINPHVAVVLHNGSPVEMPWVDDVGAILEMYLGGQAVGMASVRLLFGDANPCGKLAETFPLRLEDNPAYLNFGGKRPEYREGLHVGYRYYDAREMSVLFPFGHGLSYTTFEYSDLALSADAIGGADTVTVTSKVTNTGERFGKEIVQLYVGKQLKGFEKLALEPGETKTAIFILDKRAFAYWNAEIHDWHVSSGDYEIAIAASSRSILLSTTIKVTADVELPFVIDLNTPIDALLANERTAPVMHAFLADNKDNIPGFLMDAFYESPLRTLFTIGKSKRDAVIKLIALLNSVG
jgi:beta-glucosidase